MDIYCIHLEYRTDRLAHLNAMKARHPSVSINLVEGIRHMNSLFGCQLSHRKCVQMAKNNGWPYIIVLEDDCDFLLPDEELLKCFRTMIEYHNTHPEIEIINGCGNLEDFVITSCEEFQGMHFLRSPVIYTGHCILYSARIYDRVLGIELGCPIDVAQNQWNTVYTYPFLATQVASYSDIQKANVAYNNIIYSRKFVGNHIRHLHNEDRDNRDGDGSQPVVQ